MTQRFTIEYLSPGKHPGFGPSCVFSRIHDGDVPRDLPLFTAGHAGLPAPRPMDADLVAHLVAFNRGIGNPLPGSLVTRLQRGVPMVIAGQQPGLLLGPLYTFWKLMSAVFLVRHLVENDGIEAVPAFWIASEDHDIFEVNRLIIAGEKYIAEPDREPVRGRMPPVGTISLERHRDDLLAFMNAHLPDTPHRAWLLDVVSAADYSGYGRFFATVAAALFREWGVVFIDALEIRRFTAPYLAAAVARIGDVENALRRGGLDLKQAGFEPPLSDAGLFEIRQDAVAARIRCAVDTGGRLETSRGRLPPEAVAEWIREEPERFSAGAALRPVLQDGVLPVGITVCGPTEMLYLWQTGPVYRELGVSRSQLHPRIHATVLPPQARRIIDKLGGLETAMNRRPPGDHDIPVADMQDLEMLRDELLRRLESAEDADPKQVSRAVDSIRHQVSRVIDSMMKTRSERLGSRRRQQERFDIMALPGGKPQERIVSLFELLAEWGPEWPEWIRDGVSVLETGHRCIIMNG